MEKLIRLRFKLALWRKRVGVFESLLSMQATTVADVIEQMIFSRRNRRKRFYEVYSIVTASLTLHYPLTIPVLHSINKNL